MPFCFGKEKGDYERCDRGNQEQTEQCSVCFCRVNHGFAASEFRGIHEAVQQQPDEDGKDCNCQVSGHIEECGRLGLDIFGIQFLHEHGKCNRHSGRKCKEAIGGGETEGRQMEKDGNQHQNTGEESGSAGKDNQGFPAVVHKSGKNSASEKS